jgi:glutamine kinase
VTSGKAIIRSFSILRTEGVAMPEEIRPVTALIEELESIYGDSVIEIEFGLTLREVILFQCRAAPIRSRATARASLLQHTFDASRDVARIIAASTDRFGGAALGVMPDWNPAEMIGIKPTPLAYSLYANLITDRTWAAARRQQGYAHVTQPLMVKVLGTPYVDIGASLASFIPAPVPARVRRHVVAACIEQLRSYPDRHDKIEFEIFPTCYKPSLAHSNWLSQPLASGDRVEYGKSLLRLTNEMIRPGGGFDRDVAFVEVLARLIEAIRARPPEERPPFAILLGYARDIAAPLFARLARAAFVATDIIRDVEKSYPHQGAVGLLNSVRTIANDLITDYEERDLTEFLRRHGHVRPGTYDIRAPSYEEAPELYFAHDERRAKTTDRQQQADDRLILQPYALAFDGIGYAFTADDFVSFARRAIRAREDVKYLYAGLVSEMLTQLTRLAAQHGVSRDLLAFATLGDIDALLCSAGLVSTLRPRLKQRIKTWTLEREARVPSLLFSPDDLFAYQEPQNAPNFITRARLVAPTVAIGPGLRDDCRGRIVLIAQADPGYDWIFTREIAGLVTAYGGLNSHMAVRCREMNVPAVIGVGPALFSRISEARMLSVDCASQHLEICR